MQGLATLVKIDEVRLNAARRFYDRKGAYPRVQAELGEAAQARRGQRLVARPGAVLEAVPGGRLLLAVQVVVRPVQVLVGV